MGDLYAKLFELGVETTKLQSSTPLPKVTKHQTGPITIYLVPSCTLP